MPAGLVKIAEGDELRVCLYSFVDSAVCLHFWNLFETPCIYASRKAPLTLKCEASFHALLSRFYAQKLDFDEESHRSKTLILYECER